MLNLATRAGLRQQAASPRLAGAGLTVIALVLLLLVPQTLNKQWLNTLTVALLYAYYAQTWNLSAGLTGMFSLAQPVFTAAGGYTSALLLIHLGWSPWLGMLVGAAIAAAIGAVVTIVTARIGISGVYFALFTMALWTVVQAFSSNWGLVGKNAGLLIPPTGGFLDFNMSRQGYYYVILAFVVICGLLTYKLLHSRLGLSFLAFRDDPDAARASGVGAVRTQITTIVISAAMSALAGTFYAMYFRFISPGDILSFNVLQYMILGTMVGGVSTVAGPIVGGLVFGVLGDELRNLPFLSGGSKGDVFTTAVYAILLVLTVRFLPGGLASLPRVLWTAWRRMSGRAAAASRDVPPPGDVADALVPAAVSEPPGGGRQRVTGAPILTARGLTMQIGGLRALDGVDLTVAENEVLAVIGPNGAGKTTLFNCLTGFLVPTAGTAQFDGRNIVGESPNQLCERGLGRTFQIAKPFPAMSALDAVAVAARRHASSYSAARASAAATLRRVDFRAPFDTLGRDLTNVNRKRLEVARALASQPRLLLLDEVCAGLTAAEVEDLVQVLRSVVAEGTSILMVEHVLSAVTSLADRVQVLDYGRVIAEGPPHEVMKSPVVAEAYLGRSATQRAASLMGES